MKRKAVTIFHDLFYVISLLVSLKLSYSYGNIVPVVEDQIQGQVQGVDLDVNVDQSLKAADSVRSQSQLSDSHANPPNVVPAQPPLPDEVNAGVKPVVAVLGPAGTSLEDGKAKTGNANDLKPTKDDWYYNPADEEENEDTWDDEDSFEDEDLDTPPPVVAPVGASEDDDDEEDEEDETNYELWAKLQNNDKEQDDLEEEEGDDGGRVDQDFDEKLLDDVVDEDLVKKNKPPTAPSKMVLFYTWMILAILIMVIGISTYQARCRGLHLNGFRHQTREDRKRLVDHEYT